MNLIRFGYDKQAGIHQRGYARPDWSLKALEDSRGFGWQVVTPRGDRSSHMSLARAIDALLVEARESESIEPAAKVARNRGKQG